MIAHLDSVSSPHNRGYKTKILYHVKFDMNHLNMHFNTYWAGTKETGHSKIKFPEFSRGKKKKKRTILCILSASFDTWNNQEFRSLCQTSYIYSTILKQIIHACYSEKTFCRIAVYSPLSGFFSPKQENVFRVVSHHEYKLMIKPVKALTVLKVTHWHAPLRNNSVSFTYSLHMFQTAIHANISKK